MTPASEKTSRNGSTDSNVAPNSESHPAIDRNAPAGSENSLGAESVRDGRPTTKSNVMEAIDEMEPGAPS
ncbi:MAG TPA: hypothetical protein VFN62_02270 [Acidobacteriaceae bacterium]|nr:hypothetical protein [Acidobacteriaceae bacterium]